MLQLLQQGHSCYQHDIDTAGIVMLAAARNEKRLVHGLDGRHHCKPASTLAGYLVILNDKG